MMGDLYSPNCLNVRFRFGEVRPTPGRDNLAGPDVTPQPALWIGQFPLLNGLIWAIKLTTTKMYRWGDTSPGVPRMWFEILPGDSTPLGASRWTVAIGEGKMFFCRIEDPVYFWDGLAASPFKEISTQAGFEGIGSGGMPKAKYCEYFNNRLILMYTVEGSTTFANRVRWPENGNFLKWDETAALGAGFLDLVEGGQEPIRNGKSFGSGSRMFIGTRRTIKDMIPTGSLDPVHQEQLRVRGYGINAPYTVGNTGSSVFFMGYDRNVYSWDGIQITPIGEPIFEELHAITEPDKMDNYFAAVSTQRQEYWLILTTGDAFVFDYARNYWTRDTVPAFTALGEVEDTTNAPRWLDMTTTWEEEHHTWEQLLGTSMTAFWGGRADGSTATIDEMVSWDYFSIGSIIDRFVETPDFYTDETAGTKEGTVYRVFLNYAFVNSNPFMTGVSFDRGVNWTEKEVVPHPRGFSWIDFIVTGNTMRFRFRENDATGSFRWRSYTFEVIESGDFIGTTTS
jgi:hypothetical protein